jgi:hypothetical protein
MKGLLCRPNDSRECQNRLAGLLRSLRVVSRTARDTNADQRTKYSNKNGRSPEAARIAHRPRTKSGGGGRSIFGTSQLGRPTQECTIRVASDSRRAALLDVSQEP